MTITTTNTRQAYAGDDSTTVFSWPYRVYDDDDILVILKVNATSVYTLKTKTTHYTITVAADFTSASVTMLTPPATGETLILVRSSDINQAKDLSADNTVNLTKIEEQLDRIAVNIQDVEHLANRALKFDPGSAQTNAKLPDPVSLESVRWNLAATDMEGFVPPKITAAGSTPGSVPEQVGDIYIDTAANEVYVAIDTVSAADWIQLSNQPGVPGTDGTDGFSPTWIAQAGAPNDVTDGVNGDMYFNTTTDEVYGPKAAGAWGAAIADLTGATGPMANVVEDTTPQAGGNLDMNGFYIFDGVGNLLLNEFWVLIPDRLGHDGDFDTYLKFANDDISLVAGGATGISQNASGVLIGTTGARVTGILDEDNMVSDSAVKLATQQSIKAYVDANNVNAILDSDISEGEGFLRKTGAGAYEAIKSNLAGTVAPTANEDSGDGYAVGSTWIDTTNDKAYVCLDATLAAAVWTEITQAGGSGSFNVKFYTANDTWTKPSGLVKVWVWSQGPGGGGGGAPSTSSNEGGGGGGGGACFEEIVAASLGATETVTIGTGGAGGAAGDNDGAAGSGSTSFGAHMTAGAGGAGLRASTGGSGAAGTATGGSENQAGEAGGAGGGSNGTGGDAASRGNAGSTSLSFFHVLMAGEGGTNAPAGSAGINGAKYGGGGSGADGNGADNLAGGNGADGAILVWEFF